jgi:hypothetical protein
MGTDPQRQGAISEARRNAYLVLFNALTGRSGTFVAATEEQAEEVMEELREITRGLFSDD